MGAGLMFRSRKRAPVPPPDPGFTLLAIPGTPKDLLDYLGAVPFAGIGVPREGECFVYGLDNAAGECFYIGKSTSLYKRLGHWERMYKNYLAGIRVLRARDEDDMIDTENFLIRRMQPVQNVNGTDEEKRRRQARARNAPHPNPAARPWSRAYEEAGRAEGAS